jgi:hypothetical protein
VSRTRFLLGRYTETQRTKMHLDLLKTRSQYTYYEAKLKSSLLFALANRNAKAGVNPNPGTDLKRRRILNDAVSACQAESYQPQSLAVAASRVNL